MDPRKTAMIVGALILVAYGVLASSVTESKIIVMIFEVISGAAVISIAVLMFPFFKSFSKRLAVSYLSLKAVEGSLMIIAGILFSSILFFGARDGIYVVHAYIFILSALIFYYLLYRSRLIPRFISIWGVIAIILLLITNLLELTGYDHPMLLYLYLPIVSNEVFLAAWLMVKGFNPSAIGSESAKTGINEIK